MEPEDIDAIYRWENDPSVWIDSASHQPFSRHALASFIEENSGADIYSCRQLRLIAEKEEIIKGENSNFEGKDTFCRHYSVGCVDLFDFDPYHKRAGLGIIVDRCFRQQGIGFQIVNVVEEFARLHLTLHQLHCTISVDNVASLALFEKAGYSRCGTLSQWIYSDGDWVDAYFYQKILNY